MCVCVPACVWIRFFFYVQARMNCKETNSLCLSIHLSTCRFVCLSISLCLSFCLHVYVCFSLPHTHILKICRLTFSFCDKNSEGERVKLTAFLHRLSISPIALFIQIKPKPKNTRIYPQNRVDGNSPSPPSFQTAWYFLRIGILK